MCPLRILLADNNDEILGAIRQELAQEFEIIGTVSNGQDAVNACNGRTKILILTIQENNEYVSAAFAAGVSGYVTKRRLLTDLGYAILSQFH